MSDKEKDGKAVLSFFDNKLVAGLLLLSIASGAGAIVKQAGAESRLATVEKQVEVDRKMREELGKTVQSIQETVIRMDERSKIASDRLEEIKRLVEKR